MAGMQNVETKVEKNKLVITVDLSKNYGPSKSGKTQIIASSAGPQEVEGNPGVFVGVNVFKKGR